MADKATITEKTAWGARAFTIDNGDGSTRTLAFRGRERWALESLILAGPAGITSLQNPAPRLSHYVFKLRSAGLLIDTLHEDHGGDFAGRHGRYILRTIVAPADAAMRGAA